MHVAVIGAGPAGLCAARHLTAPNSGFTCVVFEQTEHIGGIWMYNENTEQDKYGISIHSAMYKNLRTNLTTHVMEFPGFPFVNSKSFSTHYEVLKYLKDYSNYYDLIRHIQFLRQVINVIPKADKWQITSTDLPNNKEVVEEFDAVVVCTGRHGVPYMGDFPSVSEFTGEVLHSQSYRTPETYTDKIVLVCGGGHSGVDIMYDLVDFATKVYLSHRNDLVLDVVPKNLQQVPAVKLVKEDYVIFEDKTMSGHIDVILLCTGYMCSFPFLAQECGIIVVENKFVQPLYKHIINVNKPTMAFIAIISEIFTFFVIDYQVRFFFKTLTGEVELMSKEGMFAEIAQDVHHKKENGVPVRKYHHIYKGIKSYIYDLAELAQLEHISPVVYNIYSATINIRKNNLSKYKELVFKIVDENNFEITGAKRQ